MSEPEEPSPAADLRPTGWALAGLAIAAGVMPQFLSITTSRMSSVHGMVVVANYRDYVAIVCGALALVFGALAIVAARKATASVRNQRFIVAAIAIVLGGYQLARGLGVFAPHPTEPAPMTTSESIPARTPTPPPAPSGPKAICASSKECNDLGQSLEKSDPARSLAAYLQGCGPEGRGNCYDAALALNDGKGVPVDHAKAAGLLEQACGYKMALACTNLGVLLINGADGVPKNEARGRTLFEQACAADDGLGCANLGELTDDPAAKLELYRKSCKLQSAAGCDDVGVALFLGDGVAKDLAGAFAAFDAACKMPDEPKCYNLGVLYENGAGVKKDLVKARELYEGSCAVDRRSCNNLGSLFLSGSGGPKDLVRARELFAMACDRGLELGCKNRDDLDKEKQTK